MASPATEALRRPVGVDVDTASVLVAWVHSTDVAYSFFASMLDLQKHVFMNGRAGRFLAMRYGSGGINEARNKVAAKFLEGDEEWLFWIDTDMGFDGDIVDRLLESADPVKRPVVGALAFANKETSADDMGGFHTFPVPTIYRWAKQPDGSTGFVSWHEYPRDELVECSATGSAAILIHRGVFERIAGKAQGREGPYSPIINPENGSVFSEDLAFCIRCLEVDAPIHVDTRVKTTHLKPVWLSQEQHDQAMTLAMSEPETKSA